MSSTTPQGPSGPEYLESSSGSPVAGSSAHGADHRKRLIVLGGLLGVLAVGGGAAWAASSFLSTGFQPAEALPAGTIGYVSVDLDPSGGQKIEAIRTLRKFPAFADNVDLDTDDDLRERLFTELTDSGECEGLDYAADVKPWLGDRAAVAAVDTGAESPSPVLVVQVTDAGEAEDGLATLQESCGSDAVDAATGGWAVEGDWAVIGESVEIADQVAADAGEDNLADDADFQRWTEEAGDPGIVSLYVAPAAGQYMADMMGLYGDSLGSMGGMDGMGGEGQDPLTPEMEQSLADFQGAAVTVRFDDGALEVETAGDPGQSMMALSGLDQSASDLVAGLPDDTVAAFGVGFSDGWFTQMVDNVATLGGSDMTSEEMMSEMSQASGLDLPADAEALAGDGVAVSMGSGFDLEAFFNGGPGELPVGVTIQGDPDAILAALDKVKAQMGPDADMLETEVDGDRVTISPNADYRSSLVEGGSLDESEAFDEVVADADEASALLFVDFDADDNWLARLAGEEDPEIAENIEPLSAFGVTGWIEDGVSHSVVRLTTD
ncbi:DUF3352 domain-containing protein [Nocardioides sp. Soil805]|uniref:DUF3352 domain-containing protein n=1 Tax=Nocardioides sp. Soil805 TaxID=1736416 RepID=UPI000702F0DD|nr:DUF3352 domain-containing protein [Nocardioides sp. Soil805]KRF36209.1 hypothetical protein ASG94_01635 [Nocardioides sp. Soil805]